MIDVLNDLVLLLLLFPGGTSVFCLLLVMLYFRFGGSTGFNL